MFVNRHFKLRYAVLWSFKEIILLTLWSSVIVGLNYYDPDLDLSLPWLPISVIGTAVAFFIGFKNNSAYQRRWEARKIWGAIVNDSRTFCILVRDFLRGENKEAHCRDIIHRHIAWLHQLKRQLRAPKPWEHRNKRENWYREWVESDFPTMEQKKELTQYISEQEFEAIASKRNMATQLMSNQSRKLSELREKEELDEFRFILLAQILGKFYGSQGKSERIKNFPIPRQYVSFSLYFVIMFIALVPLGMVDVLRGMGRGWSYFGAIPLSVLIGWIFWATEVVGDYTEIPFEGMMDDIPMSDLTRTIEIDLKEMIGEKDIPKPLSPINDYIM